MDKCIARNLSAIAVLLLIAFTAMAQVKYFPEEAAGGDPRLDKFVDWYSVQLTALKEPSLLEMANTPSSESYRFLWLRTFHHPIAIRLDVKADGSSVLTTKITSGEGGYESGVLTVNTSRNLTQEQTQNIVKKIEEALFWSMPILDDGNTIGVDGAEWIVEGVKNGKYHVVTRWSPESGAIRELGLAFIHDLAKLSIPKNEMY